jgi:trehalose 6-phosphate phosphatase
MRNILSRAGRKWLAEAAARKDLLLGLDYDGTLAPFRDEPSAAVMAPSTARLLQAAAALYPCAILSGRSRADLLRLLGGLKLSRVVGSHGLEPSRGSVVMARQAARWKATLERRLPEWPGVWIEQKRFSCTVHYRLAPRKVAVLAAIRRVVEAISGTRRVYSKDAVDLLPDLDQDKGTAMERVCRQLHCSTALFIGDDASDEDVFDLESSGLVTGIRVGRYRHSVASWFLESQAEVDELLTILVDARIG